MKNIGTSLGKLMQAAYECNRHDVFIEYSPHVKLICIRIYMNGWKCDSDENEIFRLYLRDKDASMRIRELTKYIEQLGGK